MKMQKPVLHVSCFKNNKDKHGTNNMPYRYK